NGDVGALILVRVDELIVVHPVEMIAREDEVMLRLVLREVPRRLTNGVRGSLKPVRVVRCLLSGEDLDKALREAVEPIRQRNVTIERRGIELRQDVDAPDVRVQAITDRNVDETVLAADRHRGLGSRRGQRK